METGGRADSAPPPGSAVRPRPEAHPVPARVRRTGSFVSPRARGRASQTGPNGWRRRSSGAATRWVRSGGDGLAGRHGRDRDLATTAAEAEGHRTRDQREQRVVLAAADAEARVEVGAALADDDLAGLDDLTAEALHAEALGVRVATVAGRRCALLVCHVVVSPS